MKTIIRSYASNLLKCVLPKRFETIEEEDDDLEIWFPSEIIENILSRLPVKSILRFKSVSKPWLSLVSNPSFTKLQLTHANIGFFISAFDPCTRKRHFLSAIHDNGSVTRLMTLDHHAYRMVLEAEHVNGLVCSTSSMEVFVFNPSMHNVFILSDTEYRCDNIGYYFGFDESRNEHKILKLFCDWSGYVLGVMIFSMSNCLWRKTDATVDIRWNRWYSVRTSVCVNSVVYWILQRRFEILAFDLRTEEFSIIKVHRDDKRYCTNKKTSYKDPYLIKINGSIGIVIYDCAVEANEVHIRILQDYENNVWVTETITFPESWRVSDCFLPFDSINTDEIIFSVRKLSWNVIGVPIYNMKTGCFRSVQFTLDHPFLREPAVKFYQIRCYAESLMPLPKELIQQKNFFHTQLLSLKKFLGYQSK